jgi:hypothetical protein
MSFRARSYSYTLVFSCALYALMSPRTKSRANAPAAGNVPPSLGSARSLAATSAVVTAES